jgi:hypothetical protein
MLDHLCPFDETKEDRPQPWGFDGDDDARSVADAEVRHADKGRGAAGAFGNQLLTLES